MSRCPPDLKKRYQEGRVLPFVGAGASISVRWTDTNGEQKRGPSWSELVNVAIKELGFSDPELARIRGTDLQILEYYKLKNSGFTTKLMHWLLLQTQVPLDKLKESKLHYQLSLLNRCQTIYTTNYDDFIEKSFEAHGRSTRVTAVEGEMGIVDEKCEIVKFHGDLNYPSGIVLTESDYEDRLSMRTALDHRLRSDLLGRVALFIGYSFRDPNVSYLFSLFKKDFHGRTDGLAGKRAYIVVPDASEFETTLFSERDIEVISVRGDQITADITSLLEDMRSS